jgi:hypothetical protein
VWTGKEKAPQVITEAIVRDFTQTSSPALKLVLAAKPAGCPLPIKSQQLRQLSSVLRPTPYTLHPTPYTLHPPSHLATLLLWPTQIPCCQYPGDGETLHKVQHPFLIKNLTELEIKRNLFHVKLPFMEHLNS